LTGIMSGPGKLTKALGIDMTLNGEDLVVSRRLSIQSGPAPRRVVVSTRVGVAAGVEAKWRFFEEGSPFVSGGRTHNYRTDAARR